MQKLKKYDDMKDSVSDPHQEKTTKENQPDVIHLSMTGGSDS